MKCWFRTKVLLSQEESTPFVKAVNNEGMESQKDCMAFHQLMCTLYVVKTIPVNPALRPCFNPLQKNKKTLRSSMIQFNFKQHCLFCGDDCDMTIEIKKPLARRKSIHKVRTITTCKSTIANAGSERGDEWGQLVLSRVQSGIDLVAAEARYHGNCYANFLKLPSKRKPGRPQNDDLAEAYEKLFSYLSEND